MTLRRELHDLERLPDVDLIRDTTLYNLPPLQPDGSLATLPSIEQLRLSTEVGSLLEFLPLDIQEKTQTRNADLSERDLALLKAGAEMVVRVVQQWVRADGEPYPPTSA